MAGTVIGGIVAYKIRDRIPEPIRNLASYSLLLNIKLSEADSPNPSQTQAIGRTFLFSMPTLLHHCYVEGFTAFLVGHFLLPGLVSCASGLTAGITFGATAIMLPPLLTEKIPE